jgi:hypothetical protein
MGSVPDEMTLFIDFPDAVKGDGLDHAVSILHFEGEAVLFVESNLAKWDPKDLLFDVVFVPDLEDTPSEFFIPANSFQQFLNRHHLKTLSLQAGRFTFNLLHRGGLKAQLHRPS